VVLKRQNVAEPCRKAAKPAIIRASSAISRCDGSNLLREDRPVTSALNPPQTHQPRLATWPLVPVAGRWKSTVTRYAL